MLAALKALGGRFASWVAGEGSRSFGKQLATNQVSKAAMRHPGGNPSMGTDMNKMIDKGHAKVGGFWGGVAISVAIGVGVSFLVPGAGFLAVGIAQGVGTNVVEAGIGVMSGPDETPEPTPEPTAEPVEENLPPVSGTDPEPEPVHQPTQTPYVYVDPGTDPGTTTTTNTHEEDVDMPHEDPPDENDGCCDDGH